VSYVGYLKEVKSRLLTIDNPNVLEIGTDKGVTFITLAYFLTRTKEKFSITGIDVYVREELKLMLNNIDLFTGQEILIYEENSLNVLPTLFEQFDVVMLDGDHNYYTVSKELELLEPLMKSTGIIVVDDYSGKWSEKDLWYGEREEYNNIKSTTQPIETEKHGVKAAVDDHIIKYPEWRISTLMQGEPVLLSRV
jgi:predicted O-methyltransferase YrrM